MNPFESEPKEQEETERQAPEMEKTVHNEKFIICQKAGRELSNKIMDRLKEEGVIERYHQAASVFYNPETLNLTPESSLEEVLQKAKELGREVVVYSGGINWRGGEHIHPTELVKSEKTLGRKITSLSQEMSANLSGGEIHLPSKDLSDDISFGVEVKKEEDTPSALNFFDEAGKTVVITIDPVYREKEVVASSLRSDAIARKTSLDAIRNSGAKPEMVNWSDGGFKDIQIQFAGYLAIIEDLRYGVENGLLTPSDYENLEAAFDTESSQEEKTSNATNGFAQILFKIRRVRGNIQSLDYTPPEQAHIKQHMRTPVFLSGYEAFNYFESLGGINNLRGGAPSIPEELAFPFNSTHNNPIIRGPMRDMANQLVKFFGIHESNKILEDLVYNKMPRNSIDQQGNILVILRLLELGRGIKGKEDLYKSTQICRLTQRAISSVKGTGRDVTLGDTSGSVVNTAPESYGTPELSQLLYGKEKSLYIETRDFHNTEIPVPSIHIEIKRALGISEALAAADVLGLITNEEDPNTRERYVPVTLEEDGKHPNGSVLHKARKLDYDKWKEYIKNRENLSSEKRGLLALASTVFFNEGTP